MSALKSGVISFDHSTMTRSLVCTMVFGSLVLSGCSYNINAVPVSRVPAEVLQVERKDSFKDISLLRLRQDPPETYLLGPGDLLGVYIKGILGDAQELPPVHFPEDGNRAPAVGYPVPVREDGTLSLPIIKPIKVEGMSVVEATNAIRSAYLYPNVLIKEEEESIIVTLMEKRRVRVLVIREEAGGTEGVSKRGTGKIVDLPAYENDVLHALSETGGMPGTDAKNEIMIYRGLYQSGVDADAILNGMAQNCQECQDKCFCSEAPLPDPPNVTRIPLRYNPASPPVFKQEDIVLGEGDIVVIRSRERETFITAGMLGGGEHPLPRDKDLDIIGAIALAGGSLGQVGTGVGGIGSSQNGGGNAGGRNGNSGGFCRPTQAIVIRELPCGDQIAIKVDLNRALENKGERILIQPNDVVMLRYTLTEEIGNVALSLMQFNFLWGLGGNGVR